MLRQHKNKNRGRIEMKKPDLKLIIPTYGRKETQKTHDCLPSKYQPLVHFIVREEEYVFFSKKYPENKIHRLPKTVKNFANTKQWIREYFTNDRVFILDDNLKYIRKVVERDGKWLRVDLTERDFDELIVRIQKYLDDFVHGALVIDKSIGAHQYDSSHYMNGRIMTNIFADFGRWPKDVKFDDHLCCLTAEDYYVNLSLISRGFANVIITDVCVTKTMREKGGCNTYRTLENHNASCLALKEQFPSFVMIKKTTVKQGAWKDKEMLTTVCYWKKAFKAWANDKLSSKGK